MIGTFINAGGILIGGVAGLTAKRQILPATQNRIKILLAAFTVYAGLSMTWNGLDIGHGRFLQVLKAFGITMLSLMLGNFTGYKLGIQKAVNGLGRYAKERFTRAGSEDSHRLSEGFITCTLLFCVGPMSILGALEDGLNGNFKILAIKAAMDGLATMAFVATFGWGVILAVVPVVAYQGTITLLAGALKPILTNPALQNSVSATGGMIVFCIALVILELKKVELANYLPSLIYAPLLTWWWK